MTPPDKGSQDISSWTKDHLLCFLLLYASHADYEYCTNEEMHINNLFSSEIYNDAKSVFENKTEYQQLQTILQLKELFITSASDKDEIALLLKELFHADGHLSRPEINLLQFLSKLFES